MILMERNQMPETVTLSHQFEAAEKSIKAKPLKALGLAAFAGFVIGGGHRSRLGIALLWFVGKNAMRGAISSAITGTRDRDDRPGKKGKRARESASRSSPDSESDESKGRDGD
jgi:hypothetical protein